MAKTISSTGDTPRRRAPATTPRDRELQLTSLAVDLAEKQIRDGTASSQIITHFLKLATVKEQLSNEKLIEENNLLRAKVQSLKSSENVERLMEQAINAMKAYSGGGSDE